MSGICLKMPLGALVTPVIWRMTVVALAAHAGSRYNPDNNPWPRLCI
ncbi:MAG: hypothetical protein QM492_08725 [Rhodobacterales bacterium]